MRSLQARSQGQKVKSLLERALAIIGKCHAYGWAAAEHKAAAGEWTKEAAAFVRKHRGAQGDAWSIAQPSAGQWFLSLRPAERVTGFGSWLGVFECCVTSDGAWLPGLGRPIPLTDPMFVGAQWQKRVTPADPFTGA